MIALTITFIGDSPFHTNTVTVVGDYHSEIIDIISSQFASDVVVDLNWLHLDGTMSLWLGQFEYKATVVQSTLLEKQGIK